MGSWRGAGRKGDRGARSSIAPAVALVAVVTLAFLAGRLSVASPGGGTELGEPYPQRTPLQVIDLRSGNAQFESSNSQGADPRELIPLPGSPGGDPSQSPGESPRQGEAQCPYYFYQDGELFEMQPGTPGNGRADGRGPGDGGSLGEGQPELFPLDPVPSPNAPPSPSPDTPAPGTPDSPPEEQQPDRRQPQPDPAPVVPGQPGQAGTPESAV